MANDRVLIKCKGCGDTIVLLKMYPGNIYTPGFTPRGEGYGWLFEFNHWAEDHLCHCQEIGWGSDLGGDPGFVLETE